MHGAQGEGHGVIKTRKLMARFRFEDLQIWREACRIGDELDDLADALDAKRKRRYAEQLRAAALSVSNNIAEGSGSSSDKDFRNFLNIAHRSVAENANIVLFLQRKKVVSAEQADRLLEELRVLSSKIIAFSRSLD
jgi:four helix bundle protein